MEQRSNIDLFVRIIELITRRKPNTPRDPEKECQDRGQMSGKFKIAGNTGEVANERERWKIVQRIKLKRNKERIKDVEKYYCCFFIHS